MSIREHLHAIREEHGRLDAELVVSLATDPAHPLHSYFEWDDTAAAHRWRIEQAGMLLRVTYRPDPEKPTELRAFMAVRGEDAPRSQYVPTSEALADPFTRELILRQMKREWIGFKRRYEDMAEFSALIRESVDGVAS